MSFLPVHTIGILNLWVFMFLFALPILITISVKRNVFGATAANFKSSRSSGEFLIFLAAKFYMMFYFIYSIFIPIRLNTVMSIAGLVIYAAGFIIYSSAWIVIGSSVEGHLFDRGPFRVSRHPVYLSAAIMFLGVGLMSNAILFLGLSIITGLTHMHNAYDEERICLETFADEYNAYMKQTHRWLGRSRRHKEDTNQ